MNSTAVTLKSIVSSIPAKYKAFARNGSGYVSIFCKKEDADKLIAPVLDSVANAKKSTFYKIDRGNGQCTAMVQFSGLNCDDAFIKNI